MRKKIDERLTINIIPANLVWPILAVFWLILLSRTFANGHSRSPLKPIAR